ncbi:MAG: amidohydrolase family protein, partial [Deltaproteobacteria bacterium]|nr:amidohydrolase family protein [Deltaproteobacteria bacterium]
MIIDVHTHIFPREVRADRDKFLAGEPAFTSIYQDPESRMAGASDLIRAMDRDGVDMSVTFGFPWSDEEKARAHNDYILEAQERYPGRIMGLASFSIQEDWTEREAERAIESGLCGLGELAVYGGGWDERVRERLVSLGQLCRSRDLPLLLHTNEPIGHKYPGKAPMNLKMIYDLVQALEGVTLILAHWGGGLFFFNLLKREVPESLADVYFDTAASPFLYRPEIYRLAGNIIGPQKILFGSDYPLIRPNRYFREMAAAGLD